MRIGIVVDSTCDLPESYFKKNNIQILPISIRLGKELLVDKRDEQATRRFYKEQLDSQGIDAESIPYSVDQIQAVFLEQLVIDYDLVFTDLDLWLPHLTSLLRPNLMLVA